MRIFGAPRRYIQGPGVIAQLGGIARTRGATPLLVVDRDVRAILGDSLTASFDGAPAIIEFAGEITLEAIERTTQAARDILGDATPILVHGVGGGKALDVAKGVALRLGADYVSVPTAASNDSPTGRAIAIYDEHHGIAKIEFIPVNPEAVVVDTAVIARAPTRFLRGGIGDAISKKFEAERSARDGARNFFGAEPTLTALAIADACYRTLRRHGVAGMRAAERQELTPDLEAVIEACVLMSGISWESGGTSLSHAVVRGVARMPGAEATLHGEHVAYGLQVQFLLDGQSEADLLDLMAFYDEIGQPTTLAGLGIADAGPEAIAQIAAWTMEAPAGSYARFDVTADEVAAAISRVEALGRARG